MKQSFNDSNLCVQCTIQCNPGIASKVAAVFTLSGTDGWNCKNKEKLKTSATALLWLQSSEM